MGNFEKLSVLVIVVIIVMILVVALYTWGDSGDTRPLEGTTLVDGKGDIGPEPGEWPEVTRIEDPLPESNPIPGPIPHPIPHRHHREHLERAVEYGKSGHR